MKNTMRKKKPATRIIVVAPANTVRRDTEAKVKAIAAARWGTRADIVFHPQCFLSEGHFAGPDAVRSAAFLEAANDPAFDAVWFGRGGYGSARLDDSVYRKLGPAARRKIYLGYSDLGFVLARLDRLKIGAPAHGPHPSDIHRDGGAAAVERALAFLIDRDLSGVEPHARTGALALNLTVLSHLLGTRAEPDFTGRVLMIEDVAEHHYRIDRALFHVTSSRAVRRAAGLMLGRISEIPANDPPFQQTEEEIIRYWCARSGLAYLGRADIGHDADNKIAPFRALPRVF